MTERKIALIILAIAIPIFSYGVFSFELGGANSSLVAASIAVSIAFGLFGIIGGLIMFFTKTNLGLLESKDTKSTKEGKKMAKRKATKATGSESIGLMQREKELVKEEEELNTSIKAIKDELDQVRTNLETKGWVYSNKGWVIE